MKTYKAAFTGDEYEGYRSEDLSAEKSLKALKILMSGRELVVGDETFILMETMTGGFDLVNVLPEDKIINSRYDMSTFFSILNHIDDKELEDQFLMFCAGEAIQKTNRRTRM